MTPVIENIDMTTFRMSMTQTMFIQKGIFSWDMVWMNY